MANGDSQKSPRRRGDPVSKRSFLGLLATISSWLAVVFVGANVKPVTGRDFSGPPPKQGGAERLASVGLQDDYATVEKSINSGEIYVADVQVCHGCY